MWNCSSSRHTLQSPSTPDSAKGARGFRPGTPPAGAFLKVVEAPDAPHQRQGLVALPPPPQRTPDNASAVTRHWPWFHADLARHRHDVAKSWFRPNAPCKHARTLVARRRSPRLRALRAVLRAALTTLLHALTIKRAPHNV